MSVFKLINETKAKGKVKKVFNDIKKTRNIKKIPNFWRAIANNPEIGMLNIDFSKNKDTDPLFSKFPNQITSLQWHSYEVQGLEDNKNVTLLASSPETKYQIFKYQNHAYGIQFHIEVKDTTVNEWGCVPEYKSALEKQLGANALEKFDNDAKVNMKDMNNYSNILYSKFKSDILKL